MPVIRYIGSHNFISTPPAASATATLQAEQGPFRIEFCNPEKRYFPGEIIEGRVIFLWSRRWKVIQGILVKLLCEGEIHYGRCTSGPPTDVVLQRTYLSKAYYLLGNGNHDVVLQSGFIPYSFMFTLPSTGLPQSFSGPYGSITYRIEAIVKNSKSSTVYCNGGCGLASSCEELTVNEYLNLNSSIPREILAGPIAITFDNNTNCTSTVPGLSCSTFSLLGTRRAGSTKKKGEIKVTLKLEKRGFVPGEFIQFGLVVENGSRKNLPTVNIEFQQVVKFIAQLTKTESQVLGRAAGPSVGPNSTSTWESCLEVPELPVSSATNSISCINITYKLKIEIETGPMSRNLRYEYPIIIGTIPFEHIPRRVRSLEYRTRRSNNAANAAAGSSNNSSSNGLLLAVGTPAGQGRERQNSYDGSFGERTTVSQNSNDCPNYLDLAIGGSSTIVSNSPPPSYEDAVTSCFFASSSSSPATSPS